MPENTPSESMPQVFDRLTALSGELADHPQPPSWELSSERELTRTDAEDRVTVTVKDFRISGLRIDHVWYHDADQDEVEERVKDAVNVAMTQYLTEELAEASDLAQEMGAGDRRSIHARLLELSADFHAAYSRQLDALAERMR